MRAARARGDPFERREKAWRWGGGLVLLVGAAVVAAALAYHRKTLLASEAALWEDRLRSAAEASAEAVSLRLELLKRDGEALAAYPLFQRMAAGQPVQEEWLRQALSIPVEGYGYRGAILLDPRSTPRASTGEAPPPERLSLLAPSGGRPQVILLGGGGFRNLAVAVPVSGGPGTPGPSRGWTLVLLTDGEGLLGASLRRAAAVLPPARLALVARGAAGEARLPLAEGDPPPAGPPGAGGSPRVETLAAEAALRGEPWRCVAWVARKEVLRLPEGRFRLEAALAASLYLLLTGLLLLWVQRRDLAAAQRLNEVRRRHETLLGNLPGIAYRCANDRNWTMEFLSDGCRTLTGYAPEDLLGNARLSYADLIHPDDRERVCRAVQRALEGRQRFTLSYRIRTRSGEIRHVWEQGTGVYDREGRLQALEGFITDVTARVQAERDLQKVQEELAQSRYLQSLGYLVGGIAHEVRNPLFALQTVAAGLKRRLEGREDLEEFFRHLDEQSSRLAALMNDLLQYGKPIQREAMTEVDLEEVLRAAVSSVLLAQREAEGRVVLTAPHGVRVRGSRNHLERLFQNLLTNAFAFSPAGEPVEVSLTVEEGQAVVTVRDRGSGIPPALLDRLFEPFVTGRKGGTGLGLAIVHRTVEVHGGTVEARNNTPDAGATFTVRLPLLFPP